MLCRSIDFFPEVSAHSVQASAVLPFAQGRAEGVPWPMRWAFGHSLTSVGTTGGRFARFHDPLWHTKVDQNVTVRTKAAACLTEWERFGQRHGQTSPCDEGEPSSVAIHHDDGASCRSIRLWCAAAGVRHLHTTWCCTRDRESH